MADPLEEEIQRQASFARNFVRGTTNLDQRRRFEETITEAKRRTEERQRREFEDLQVRDPKVGNLVLGRQREARMAQNQRFQQGLAQERFALENERMELGLRNEQRAIERERINNKKMELDLDRKLKEDADILEAEEAEFALREQFKPGSTEYRDGIMNIALGLTGLSKDYRALMLKSAGFDDPELAYQNALRITQENPGARVTGVPVEGGGKATVASPKPVTMKPTTPARMDQLRAKIQKQFALEPNDRDQDYINYLQGEFEKEKGRVSGQPTNPQSQGQVASQPNNFSDQQSFTQAYQNAASGTVLYYNGKPWRKP